MNPYICLTCGSKHGEDTEKGSENWYWRILEHGRIGPFCRQSCASAFSLNGSGPAFTLEEWERMRFIQYLYRQDPAADQAVLSPMSPPVRLA